MRCIASAVSILGLVCTGWIDSIAGVLRVYVPVVLLLLALRALWYRSYRYGLRLPAGLAIVDLWASYHVGKIRFHILEIHLL